MENNNEFSLYRNWARNQFDKFRDCVAFIEVQDEFGEIRIGSCFHVGEGTFVTARHVIENLTISHIGFDDYRFLKRGHKDLATFREACEVEQNGIKIEVGPFFHSDSSIDIACFRATPFPDSYIPLGGHFDDFLGRFDLLLYRTLILGYPPIPFSNRPNLIACSGEVTALIDKYTGGHPHFLISTMARGGFSGGPVLIAYNESNEEGGTAALGIVTESLIRDNREIELGYLAVLTVEPIYNCLETYKLLPEVQRYDMY